MCYVKSHSDTMADRPILVMSLWKVKTWENVFVTTVKSYAIQKENDLLYTSKHNKVIIFKHPQRLPLYAVV